jgi:TfoX/Sxy family transcriptional regulator of competence genes
MSKTPDQVPQEKLDLYCQLIDMHPDIERKGGVKLPYTSHNGNMFTLLTKEGKVALRLGKADREAFIEKYNSRLCEQYGTVMKEYVEVPDALLANPAELQPYLALSYAYVQTLKPKPTKKKGK